MKEAKKEIDEFINLTVPRFLKYARFWTTSDRRSPDTPSSSGQWELARALADELKGLGKESTGSIEVTLTDHCYVIARVSASPGLEHLPVVGFLAHLDTSEEVSGKDVEPCLIKNYDGNRIDLGGGIFLDPANDSGLAAQKGKAIIHSGGGTLLGADDKAGIAIIAGAAEYLLAHGEIPHGPLELIFSPDEETGKGLPCFPRDQIKAKVCYTVDGGPEGLLEWECFNAWEAEINFSGVSAHLGQGRGRLVNAALMAAVYAAMLPRNESPEATDGYYGFYCPLSIRGDIETALLEVYIRDFDFEEGKRKIAALDVFAKAVEAQFPGGKAVVTSKVQYLNMKEKIGAMPQVLEKLRRAFLNSAVQIREKPIRGGTDGSRLTELGIPTPNIYTGGRNFHSRMEWLSVSEMASSCRLLVELIRLWSE